MLASAKGPFYASSRFLALFTTFLSQLTITAPPLLALNKFSRGFVILQSSSFSLPLNNYIRGKTVRFSLWSLLSGGSLRHAGILNDRPFSKLLVCWALCTMSVPIGQCIHFLRPVGVTAEYLTPFLYFGNRSSLSHGLQGYSWFILLKITSGNLPFSSLRQKHLLGSALGLHSFSSLGLTSLGLSAPRPCPFDWQATEQLVTLSNLA